MHSLLEVCASPPTEQSAVATARSLRSDTGRGASGFIAATGRDRLPLVIHGAHEDRPIDRIMNQPPTQGPSRPRTEPPHGRPGPIGSK